MFPLEKYSYKHDIEGFRAKAAEQGLHDQTMGFEVRDIS